MNSGMAAQLIELTRQVSLLNSRAQSTNEVCGLCGAFGHGANICPQNMYESEQINYMNANQPKPRFDPYTNTYNPGWRSYLNFSQRTNNQAPIHNTIPNSMSNNDQPRKSTLEETLNTFIEFSMDNHKRHNQRLDLLEASIKRVKVQVGQIAEQLQGHQKGKLPSQPEQAMAITIHQESQESKENDNGVEESPIDNMPLH